MNKAEQAKQFIDAALASGRTVYLQTALKAIAVSPATVAKWRKAGRDLFRMDADGLRVASGRSYNLICTPSTCLVRISAE